MVPGKVTVVKSVYDGAPTNKMTVRISYATLLGRSRRLPYASYAWA